MFVFWLAADAQGESFFDREANLISRSREIWICPNSRTVCAVALAQLGLQEGDFGGHARANESQIGPLKYQAALAMECATCGRVVSLFLRPSKTLLGVASNVIESLQLIL